MNFTFDRWCRGLFGMVAVLCLAWGLTGCAGSSKKAEEPAKEEAVEPKGSLSKTFTLMDETGRKSGTLTITPFGGAILRDENGQEIGRFQPEGASAPQSAVKEETPEPNQAPPGTAPSAETVESEVQSETEAKE